MLQELLVRTFRRVSRRNLPHAALFVLTDKEMKALKQVFRRRMGRHGEGVRMRSRGVLAFPEPPHFPHPERRGKFLGEIYLNKNVQKQPREEQIRLLAHGLLHLLGYRHGRSRDRMSMEGRERRLTEEVFRKSL